MIIANTRNLIHAISIDGNVVERYFAVTSEAPRKTVDARTSAMPRKGRSARAGAARAFDFFSDKGNEALSSLAAAAGGGVTVELGCRNYRIGVPQKRQLPSNDKVRKQEADMRDCARRLAAAAYNLPHPEERALARVSKDGPSWFETALCASSP
jgi:hypothetical protein